MAERKLLSIGYEIPGFSDRSLPFASDRSLLDADVILFQPTLRDFHASTLYQGKRRISDNDSVRAVEHCRRWHQEITESLKAGKTVIVFLSVLEEVYVHLGQTRVSGTGRSQRMTYIVESLTNYSALPFDLGTVIPKGGTEIRTVGDLKQLAPYWAIFGSQSPYNVYLKQPSGAPVLTAKSPDAIVGLLVKIGRGSALLLPPVEYDEDEFTGEDKKGEAIWTKEAVAFGSQLVSALLELDRARRAETELTPAPDWVRRPELVVPAEKAYETAALALDAQIDQLRAERDSLMERAVHAGSLRDLLYEGGKPLERVILRALQDMGFVATPFKDDASEFDAVFSSAEGRFIGEAEGKNDKAISVEKLDQLERNIREDFARQSSGTYAKGVLFGNAYRVRDVADRPEFFTAKCHAAALRGKVALVRTPDLFLVARYLEENPDEPFAAACRKAILEAEGIVVAFPPPPVVKRNVEAV